MGPLDHCPVGHRHLPFERHHPRGIGLLLIVIVQTVSLSLLFVVSLPLTSGYLNVAPFVPLVPQTPLFPVRANPVWSTPV